MDKQEVIGKVKEYAKNKYVIGGVVLVIVVIVALVVL